MKNLHELVTSILESMLLNLNEASEKEDIEEYAQEILDLVSAYLSNNGEKND